jgi:pseudaminic acid cytidylyltransferase
VSRIAIIPARAGSKRIPNKNFLQLDGKPIVGHVIRIAESTGIFDEIVISLDSNDKKESLLQFGASLHLRPRDLGRDEVKTIDVIKEVIAQRELADDTEVCCLYPTSFLLSNARIIEGHELLRQHPTHFIFAAQHTAGNPLRSFSLDPISKKIIFLDSEAIKKNSQSIKEFYSDAGQFYWGIASTWLKQKDILSSESIPLLLERWETIDIDYPQDLAIALFLRSKLDSERNK